MSLLVDVSITAASIVEAAWARAVANRERLARRMDIQATREDAARDNRRNIPWEQLYTTPTPTLYKPDEPVAHPFPDGLMQIGRVYTYTRNPDVTNNSPLMRVWSGDGLQSATLPIEWRPPSEQVTWDIVNGNPEQISSSPVTYRYLANTVYLGYTLLGGSLNVYSPDAVDFVSGGPPPVQILTNYSVYYAVVAQQVHVLPIKGNTCIVCFTWETEGRGLVNSTTGLIYDNVQRFKGQSAYLVGPSFIREVPVPPFIADRPAEGASSRYYYTGPTNSGVVWPLASADGRPAPAVVTPIQYTQFGETNRAFWASFPLLPPESFRTILPANAANSPYMAFLDNSGQYVPTSVDPFTLVTSDTAYKWSDTPTFPAFNQSTLTTPWGTTKIRKLPDSVVPAHPDIATAMVNFLRPQLFWDWGKPDYCREQLLALGFQPADLAP